MKKNSRMGREKENVRLERERKIQEERNRMNGIVFLFCVRE